MTTDLQDLVGFLTDKKPEVRKMAVDIVSGLTGSPDGVDKLKAVTEPLLTGLLRLVPDADTSVSAAALTALVNLSQDAAVGELLVQKNVVGRVMEYIREKSCPHIELLLMLLVNETVTDQGCEDLLQLGKTAMEGLNMALLLKMFVTSAVTLMPGQQDPFGHIGAVLTNATRQEAGRKLLLQPGRGFLQALAAQLSSPGCSVMRRRGCAGAIKNCCISSEADNTVGEIVADEAVLTRMLAALGGSSSNASGGGGSHDAAAAASNGGGAAAAAAAAGAAVNGSSNSSSSSSSRDSDDGAREALAEAIAALASAEAGRKALWQLAAPEMLKKAYEDEHNPEVCRAMEHAARCFMFDCDAGSDVAVEPPGLPDGDDALAVE